MGHRQQTCVTAGVQADRVRQEHPFSFAARILGHDSSLRFLSRARPAPPEVLAARCRIAGPPQHYQLLFSPHDKTHSVFKPPFNNTANRHASWFPGCASPQSCFVPFALNKTKKMVNKNFCRYILFLFLRPSEANSSALMGFLLIRLTLLVTLALNVSAV